MTKIRKSFVMTLAVTAITVGFLAGMSSGHAGPGNNGGYPPPGPGSSVPYGK